MNTARMAILGVASLAGICCVGVLMHGLAGAKAPPPAPVVMAAAPPPIPTQQVLVAAHDLPVGQRIQGADMTWATWPASAVNVEYVTQGPPVTAAPAQGQLGQAASKVASLARTAVSNPADGAGSAYVGAIVREKISRNEPLVASKVVRAGQSGIMAVTLDPGMRAVALPLTAESAAGGFILPGDHVDVIMSRQLDAQNASASPTHGNAASTVMRNVRVLAIDQNMGGAAAKPGASGSTAAAIGATATVEVTPEQAERLVLAKASGSLTLSLRSYADAAGGAEIGSFGGDASGGGATVRVFRNSASTSVTVAR
jgi:pilus assembly protein CpaB